MPMGRAAAWRACTALASSLLRPQLACKSTITLQRPVCQSSLVDALSSCTRGFRTCQHDLRPAASRAIASPLLQQAQQPSNLPAQLLVLRRWASRDGQPLQSAKNAVLNRLPKGVSALVRRSNCCPAPWHSATQERTVSLPLLRLGSSVSSPVALRRIWPDCQFAAPLPSA